MHNYTQDDMKQPGFDKLHSELMNNSMSIFNGTYRGIVTRCKTDNKKSQYIRVKILGITDTLPDKAQPWARGSGTHPVPAPGTYVNVTFENGDIHFPIWSEPSKARRRLVTRGQKQSKQQNQEIYNAQDGTTISYDKSTGEYTIDHFSGAKFSIDNTGSLSHTVGPAGLSLPKFKVLTEATICPFTCSPHVGGTSYLQVSSILGGG